MANGIITPCNMARSWHWFHQVTAPCNVACGTGIMTVNSPSGTTLQCDTWLWDDMPLKSPVAAPCNVTRSSGIMTLNSPCSRWQQPATWQVALGWHAMKFAQTSAILEFYIRFRFWSYHRSQHVILHQSAKFYPNRTALSRKKWHHVDFQDGGSQPSWILGVHPIMSSLKTPRTTSYTSSIDTIAVDCLVFEKSRFFAFWHQDLR